MRATRCSCCSTRAGIACSTGSACSAGIAQPSHVLLAMGGRASGLAARSASPSATPPPGRHRCLGRRHRCRGRARPPGGYEERDQGDGSRCLKRRLMPSTTLVHRDDQPESTPACAGRDVGRRRLGGRRRPRGDAGHDVTGVHLALSRNPTTYRTGARGCCTLEDARDARRAADVIGIPFYVWDLAERFHDRCGRRLRRRVRGRPHPEPVPALQREDQVRGGARPRARARLRRGGAPGTTRIGTAGGDRVLHRSVDLAKDQSYVLAVLTARPARRRDVPAWRIHEGRGTCGGRRRGLAVAEKPDSHDICFIADGDTRGLPQRAPRRGSRRDRGRTPVRWSAPTTALHGFTVGQRRGLGSEPAGTRRPAAVRPVDHAGSTNTVTVGPGGGARRLHCGRETVRCGPAARADRAGRVRGPAARPRRAGPGRGPPDRERTAAIACTGRRAASPPGTIVRTTTRRIGTATVAAAAGTVA